MKLSLKDKRAMLVDKYGHDFTDPVKSLATVQQNGYALQYVHDNMLS